MGLHTWFQTVDKELINSGLSVCVFHVFLGFGVFVVHLWLFLWPVIRSFLEQNLIQSILENGPSVSISTHCCNIPQSKCTHYDESLEFVKSPSTSAWWRNRNWKHNKITSTIKHLVYFWEMRCKDRIRHSRPVLSVSLRWKYPSAIAQRKDITVTSNLNIHRNNNAICYIEMVNEKTGRTFSNVLSRFSGAMTAS